MTKITRGGGEYVEVMSCALCRDNTLWRSRRAVSEYDAVEEAKRRGWRNVQENLYGNEYYVWVCPSCARKRGHE